MGRGNAELSDGATVKNGRFQAKDIDDVFFLRHEAPEPHLEAKAIAIDLGVSYEIAEVVWLHFGQAKARAVIAAYLQCGGATPSRELTRLHEPQRTAGEMDGLHVSEVRQRRRSLVERKARRAKRKQRGKP